MSDKKIQHGDPHKYEADVKVALDAFQQALTKRYVAEFSQNKTIWTVHGPKTPTDVGPQPQPGQPPTPGQPPPENAPDTGELAELAREAREQTQAKTPRYYQNNLAQLDEGFDALGRTAKLLGAGGKADNPGGLGKLVNNINQEEGGVGGFAEWSGLSADKFGDFGKCAAPALENQKRITQTLSNMYAIRGSIVEMARANTLSAIYRAAQKLGATVPTNEENVRWLVIGLGGAVVGALLPGPGWVGLALDVALGVGGYLDSATPDEKFADDIGSIVEGMWGELQKLSSQLEHNEWELYQKASELEGNIRDVSSRWLELPDLSQISESDGKKKPGFSVDIGQIKKLAQDCFDASEEYQDVIKALVDADSADEQLRGAGFQRTPGDAKVLETREALHGFLRATCARYHEAGERLKEAARRYYEDEQEKVEILKGIESDVPDFNGERPGKGGTVDQNLKPTDRSKLEPDFP